VTCRSFRVACYYQSNYSVPLPTVHKAFIRPVLTYASPECSGVARVSCALGQEIFLRPLSTKTTEFEAYLIQGAVITNLCSDKEELCSHMQWNVQW